MGVFSAFFGCRGVVGFNSRCLGVSSGDSGFTVACISGCKGAVGFKAARSLRHVREKVRPARPDVGASAKKFAQRAENTPILAILGLLGELFRGSAAGGAVLGEFFRAYRHRGQVIQVTWRLHARNSGGFALHEALWGRVAGVSDPRVVQIPPFGGGEAPTWGDVLAKLQIHWATTVKNAPFWLNGSALSRNRQVHVRCLIDAALQSRVLTAVLAAGPFYWRC